MPGPLTPKQAQHPIEALRFFGFIAFIGIEGFIEFI